MPDFIIAKVDAARQMLIEAKDATDAKRVVDIAHAAEVYARRQRMSAEAISYAHEIMIEAERLLGEFLKRTKRAKGGQPYQKSTSTNVEPVEPPETLAEIGISKKESSTAQFVATLAEEIPELYEQVKSGKTTTSKAKKETNKRERRERQTEETKESLTEQAIIIAGDCLTVIDSVAPIDLLLTDPPYFTDGDFTSHISAYLAKVKPTGQAYVFAGSSPEEIAAYLRMDTHDMRLEQMLVWNYNNTGQRQPNERYTSNYQVCFYYRGPMAPSINKPADGTYQYACQTVNAPDARIGDRWHEWQKPMSLIERMILNSSKPGDFVFDPFAGSGTTMLAAAKLGRKARGCDIDQKAIDICIERGCKYE